MNAAVVRMLLAKHVTDPQLLKLTERLLSSKLEFSNCEEVPAHDIGIYGFKRVAKIEGKLDGKPAVILVGLP